MRAGLTVGIPCRALGFGLRIVEMPGRFIRVYAGFRLRIIPEIAPALVRPLGAEIVVGLRDVVCQRHRSAIAPFLPLSKILPRQATAALRLNPVQEFA